MTRRPKHGQALHTPFIGTALAGCCSLFGLACSFSGCAYDVAPVPPSVACDTAAAVTFTGTIQPILDANCALPGCHVPGGQGSGDFTGWAGIHYQVTTGNLLPSINQIPGATAMPPDGTKLSDCDIAKIARWVAGGATDN